jgi:Protein of unknown function (DUF3352)
MARGVRGLVALFLCGLFLAAPGCGGDDDGATTTTLAGADVVPADAPLFLTIDTDLESEQWQTAQDLLDKFPGKERLLDELRESLEEDDVDFERDVRPVLGPELGVAWLDIEDDDTFVGFMQAKDEAKLNALLEKGDEPLVHTKIGDWTVFTEKQQVLDRFRRAQEREKLADSEAYEEAVQTLPEDALFRLYFGGPQVRRAIEKGLAEEGIPERFSGQFGDFRSAALALTAESDGVRLEADVVGGSENEFETYEPQLPGELPAGALLFLSFANLDDPARDVLQALDEFIPNFDEQRRQAEQAFGFSVENDLLPLLENELAFAIYEEQPLPSFVLAIGGDEAKAVQLMDKLGALLAIGGEGEPRQEQVQGITLKQIQIEGTSIYYAALDGLFVASNTRSGVLDAAGDGPRLADDEIYQAALEGADAEGGTVGLIYGNLKNGLPYVFDFAEDEGETVPQVARENVKPLESFVFSMTQDDNRFEISGFLRVP